MQPENERAALPGGPNSQLRKYAANLPHANAAGNGASVRERLNDSGVCLKSYVEGQHRSACPQCARTKHRPHDDALAVLIDDRGFTAVCHRCGWKPAMSVPRSIARRPAPARTDDGEGRTHAALRIWQEARPIAGTLAEKYLRSRNVTTALCLRFHARCWHSEVRQALPSMVALMRDIRTNEPCGVHRTYLSEGASKFAGGKAKMMLGRAKGAAIKLTGDEAVTMGLGICEGIETGLSVMQAGWPVWAVGSAGSIAEFPVLSGIECLTVFADADETGQVAAEACAKRWAAASREAFIVTPKMAGDWNDWARGAA